MAISRTNNRWLYVGNGAATDFDVDERIQHASHISVFLIDPATQIPAPQSQGTHYSVLDVNDPDGSIVRFVTAPGVGISVVILVILPLQQTADLLNLGRFNPAIHEAAFDRLLQQIRQLDERLGRAILAPDGSQPFSVRLPGPLARRNLLLGFDDIGDPTVLPQVEAPDAVVPELDLVAYTVDAPVLSSDDGLTIYSNTGASGSVTLTLDPAVVSYGALFFRDPEYNFPLNVQLSGGSRANGYSANGLIEILDHGIFGLECLTTAGHWVVVNYGTLWGST